MRGAATVMAASHGTGEAGSGRLGAEPEPKPEPRRKEGGGRREETGRRRQDG